MISTLMKRLVLTIPFALLVCCAAAEPATDQNSAALGHYHIRADQLPPPYATPSAGRPPRVGSPPAGATLHVPPGFAVNTFAASGFEEPRFMMLAPNGDVFVADTGAGRVVILRDSNGDGVAEKRFVFAENLDGPFGLALWRDFLYVGNTNGVVRFAYKPGQTLATGEGQPVMSLPSGGHSTRNIIFSPDGQRMFIAVGSGSNDRAGEEPIRAAISVSNPDGSNRRVFASGLRNPTGMAFYPGTADLYTTVNERDSRGNDLPPDYMTSVHEGDFFGWPYAYIGPHPDPKNGKLRPDLVTKTRVPDVLIQAHSAALGLAFYNGTMFPVAYRGGAFIALHGSWNRDPLTGYKIVFAPFGDGKAVGSYDDFLTGWLPDPNDTRVWGRPVGLLVLRDGSLLISDDGAGKIWRVSYGKK
jgi:glucose/arabinose dehydrogenase